MTAEPSPMNLTSREKVRDCKAVRARREMSLKFSINRNL
jgi:hypothetical protein